MRCRYPSLLLFCVLLIHTPLLVGAVELHSSCGETSSTSCDNVKRVALIECDQIREENEDLRVELERAVMIQYLLALIILLLLVVLMFYLNLKR